jgi:hypothetical protein
MRKDLLIEISWKDIFYDEMREWMRFYMNFSKFLSDMSVDLL